MMKHWRILLWVLALGLLVGPVGVGCSSKKEKEEKEEKARVDSFLNIRGICHGFINYLNDHDDQIPNSLEEVKPYMKNATWLESPRKPKDFDGPSYIYVEALGGKKMNQFKPFYEYVFVYENPAFCPDYINVGYLDGSYKRMTLAAFRKTLEATYKKLGEAMPEGI